jgi:hypothetical protein
MNRSLWVALGLSVVSGSALAETADVPGDFAYGIPLSTPQAATAYRVAIPSDVYAKSTHEDLRDVRVFNAAGEVVPYEIQQTPLSAAPVAAGPSLPLFALRADSRPSLDGVRVTIQSSGTAVNLQAGAAPAQRSIISSYLLDARQIDQPFYALQLQWPPDAADFTGAMRVEGSDDLRSWHTAVGDAPVVNLHGSGTQLEQQRIVLDGSKASFWRLTWIGRVAPFEVTSVTAQMNLDGRAPQTLTLTAPGSVVTANPLEYTFDLGARLPVTKIDLVLPQINSVAKVQLLSRKLPSDPWRPIGSGEFFRIHAGAAERHNAPLETGRDYDRFWLARFDRAPGTAAWITPRLQVTWDAQDIVFLAHGTGPYQLAYGSGVAKAASSPLAALLGAAEVAQAAAGAAVTLGGADLLLPPPHTVRWKITLLWTVLGIGMLLLAFMAYRIFRELANKP